MLNSIKNAIKKVLPFQINPNYKSLYEEEKRLRKELETNHKELCDQMNAVLKESKDRYTVYKVRDHNKEF
jgi:predicted ATP-grasp superfamily ATP-dependent carboligase